MSSTNGEERDCRLPVTEKKKVGYAEGKTNDDDGSFVEEIWGYRRIA